MADIMLAETKRSMMEHANQVIVVCDHTKLGNTSVAQFATPAQIDTIPCRKMLLITTTLGSHC